jgi:hypothetical protein
VCRAILLLLALRDSTLNERPVFSRPIMVNLQKSPSSEQRVFDQ